MEKPPKILVVDDRPENLLVLERLIRQTGAETVRAGSGNEALKATLHHDFALAILDVQMPDMDGYELAECMRRDRKTKDIPIIFLSAVYSDDRHVFRGYEAGAVDFLAKPYMPEILVAKVNVFLQLDRQRRELQAMHLRECERSEKALESARGSLHRLVEKSPDGIVVVNHRGIVLFVNAAANRILGRGSDELLGTVLGFPVAGDSIIEVDLLRGDGTRGNGEISSVAITWEGGDAYLITIRDTTERKSVERRLRHAQKMEAIGTLAAGIAHDFNNILSAIIGYAWLALQEVDKDSEIRLELQEILNGGNRAKELVQQILAYSREGEQEESIVYPHLIIQEALKLLRAAIPTSIDIRTEIDKETGPVKADPAQIHQVIMNLCTNARDAMEEQGGLLEVTLRNVTVTPEDGLPDLQPGEFVRLTVRDTGLGMPPEVLERIFDPYFSTKEKGRGTGLGLAVVQGIIKRHAGAVMVTSKPGAGAKFRLYLPVAERTAAPEASLNACRNVPGGRERVLFVDDEDTLARIGKKMLERLGYEVTTENDGVKALKRFKSSPGRFDLVITDMTMPDMTGDKLAQELMRIRPDLPVILYTGYSDRITQATAEELGVRAFCMKPLDMEHMAHTVRRVLDGK